MSIKQEDFTKTPAKTFSTLVKAEVYKNRDLWYLEDRIPSLGEVCVAGPAFRRSIPCT